jgi:biopolymer transport protein ExbD
MPDSPPAPNIPHFDWDHLPPVFEATPGADEGTVPQRRVIKKANIRVPALNITSFMDMCFCLLTFLVLSASFAGSEGVLTAKLPAGTGVGTVPDQMPKNPIIIDLTAVGQTEVRISLENVSEQPADFTGLRDLLTRMQNNPALGRHGPYDPGNPIIIEPEGRVLWQHVVNAFNAAVAARYTQIAFAQARGSD